MIELKPDTNYCLISKSEFLKNRVADYLVYINSKVDILTEKSIFGKYLMVSDTEEPTKRRVVISYKDRSSEEFSKIDIDKNVVPLTMLTVGVDLSSEGGKQLLKMMSSKLARTEPEIAYYYAFAVCSDFIRTNEVDYERGSQILNSKAYKGVHTATECYQGLIEFVQQPNEISLNKLIMLFNDDDYQKMINYLSNLVMDTPEWLSNKFNTILNNKEFIKNLLKISLIASKSKNRDYFIIMCLKEIIYQ